MKRKSAFTRALRKKRYYKHNTKASIRDISYIKKEIAKEEKSLFLASLLFCALSVSASVLLGILIQRLKERDYRLAFPAVDLCGISKDSALEEILALKVSSSSLGSDAIYDQAIRVRRLRSLSNFCDDHYHDVLSQINHSKTSLG